METKYLGATSFVCSIPYCIVRGQWEANLERIKLRAAVEVEAESGIQGKYQIHSPNALLLFYPTGPFELRLSYC